MSIPSTPITSIVKTEPYKLERDGRPNRLKWTNDPKGAITHRHRPKTAPHLDPRTDATIKAVLSHREDHVTDMIQAMYSLDTALDRADFSGRTLFDRHHKDAAKLADVEAACQLLFQQILDQCVYGWFGHELQDRLQDKLSDRPLDVDKTCTCQQRMDNVILTLRDWKSVCRDVLYSDEKIMLLANAPATTCRDKRTHQRSNNTKREAKKKGDNAKQLLHDHGPVDTKRDSLPPREELSEDEAKEVNEWIAAT